MEVALPQLDDGQVAVRPPRVADAVPYVRAFNDDPQLGALLGLEADPTLTLVQSRVSAVNAGRADRSSFALTIAQADPDTFLGEVIVHSLQAHNRRAELGFWVVPQARRRGVARRALALVTDWLFNELDLLRLEITTTPDNAVVPLLAEDLGFTREGVLRARNIERGRRVDILCFGLLRDEWRVRPTA